MARTRPLGTAAAWGPDGEPRHYPPAAPGARRADHGRASHSPPGPPGLCFREPDPRKHFGAYPLRAPSHPRTLLGGQGRAEEGQSGVGGLLRDTGDAGRRARAAGTDGGEEAPPRPGRRRAGTQRGACARRKLQPPARARTGGRRALPGALTPGLRARGAPATRRKFPQSAPTRVPGRGGEGPRHLCRHTKEQCGFGVCGWPRGACPDVNKPRGPR